MRKVIVNSVTSCETMHRVVDENYKEHHYTTYSWLHGVDRSVEQNKKIYWLYEYIAKQKGDMTAQEVRHYCKYHIGIKQILARDNDYWQRTGEAYKKINHLDYEAKLALMELIPVTSEFTTDQASEYIDAIHLHFSEQGISFAEG